MKLSKLFEQYDNGFASIYPLFKTQLIVFIDTVDGVVILKDIPNTISDTQFNHLVDVSFTDPVVKNQIGYERICNSYEEYCENSEGFYLSLSDLAQLSTEEILRLYKVYTWKEFVQYANATALVDDNDFED